MKKFNKDILIHTLNRVSISLKRQIKTYLIGGLAMGTYGLKESTKDVDLVFSERSDSEEFIHALSKMGYHKKIKLDNIYNELGAQRIYTSESGQNFDIRGVST